LEFALEQKKDHPEIDPGRLAFLIGERFGVQIHRTTVMRGMKKKPRSRAKLQTGKIRGRRGSSSGAL
jgi:hypothetical protein